MTLRHLSRRTAGTGMLFVLFLASGPNRAADPKPDVKWETARTTQRNLLTKSAAEGHVCGWPEMIPTLALAYGRIVTPHRGCFQTASVRQTFRTGDANEFRNPFCLRRGSAGRRRPPDLAAID